MVAQQNSAVTPPVLKRHCQLNNYLNHQSAARGLALTRRSSSRKKRAGLGIKRRAS